MKDSTSAEKTARSPAKKLAKTIIEELSKENDGHVSDGMTSDEESKTQRKISFRSSKSRSKSRSKSPSLSRSRSRSRGRQKFVNERSDQFNETVTTPVDMSEDNSEVDEKFKKKKTGDKRKRDRSRSKKGKKHSKQRIETSDESESSSSSEESSCSSDGSSSEDSCYRRKRRSRSKTRRCRDRQKKRRYKKSKRSRSRSSSSKTTPKRKRGRPSNKTKNKYEEQLDLLRKELARLKKGKSIPDENNKTDNNAMTLEIKINKEGNLIRSPSDTAIYAPAVAKKNPMKRGTVDNSSVTDEFILDYIKKVRLSEIVDKEPVARGSGTVKDKDGKYVLRDELNEEVSDADPENFDQVQQARMDAPKNIIEAERYKANLAPTGTHDLSSIMRDPDDDFFHTICHVEQSLRDRIKRGEFVELEKLLKRGKLSKSNDEQRLEIRNKDGVAYFTPSTDRDTRINGIGRWDQAFRVYATIYSRANPTRAAEIRQYVDVIHRAARIFSWDNVANYDFVFRQLMAENPLRNWSKTYTQMWNLTLCEPTNRLNHFGGQSGGKRRDTTQGSRDGTCWRFNKGKCRYGQHCRFEHKCSYCGSHNHAAIHCSRKNKKNDQGKTDRAENTPHESKNGKK